MVMHLTVVLATRLPMPKPKLVWMKMKIRMLYCLHLRDFPSELQAIGAVRSSLVRLSPTVSREHGMS